MKHDTRWWTIGHPEHTDGGLHPAARTPGSATRDPFDEQDERMRMPTNPDTIAWLCPACGKKTRANLRTGLAFSHTRPGSTTACDLSAAAVLAPSIDGPAPELAPQEPSPQHPATKRYFDGPTSSVRAIPSGAPGGSRRH